MTPVLGRFACVVCVSSVALCVLMGAAEPVRPVGTRAPRAQTGAGAVDAGQKLFATACKVCHGEEGVGNRAPALRGERFTADFVTRTVTNGRPGTLMPKFGGSFTEAQINQLGSYIASLQERRAEWAALQGDPEGGRSLFFDQARKDSCGIL